MPRLALAIIFIGWLLWMAPLILIRVKRNKSAPQHVDRRARWGIVLQGVAFFLVFAPLRPATVTPLRIALSVTCFALAAICSWTSFHALGRQWRFDAGLNADHELVRSGMYRFVRHPIYLSMMLLMLGTGLLKSAVPIIGLAWTLSIIGTEIRVRIEDGLLASRFGGQFAEYRRRVPAYLPFVR